MSVRNILAGMPPSMQLGVRQLLVTSEERAMTHPGAMHTPFEIVAQEPIHTCSPMLTSAGALVLTEFMYML